MKWWRFSGLILILTANMGNAMSSGSATAKAPSSPVAWRLLAAQRLVINGGGIDIKVQPVPTAASAPTVEVLKDRTRPPQVLAKYQQGVLTLTFVEPLVNKVERLAMQGEAKPAKAQVVVTVPQNLWQLTVKDSANLQMALPASVQQLTLQDSDSVTITGRQLPLQRLLLDHVKHLSLQGLGSSDLLASIRHSGLVSLEGNVGLRELQIADSAKVVVGRVNSRQLTVQARDQANVYLSGTATWLSAEVLDKAHIDAKYMQSQTAFIKTQQQAVAEVTVADSLNADAQGKSNIYYYRQPTLLGRYYQDLGSILFMGDQPPPCAQPECARMPNNLPG